MWRGRKPRAEQGLYGTAVCNGVTLSVVDVQLRGNEIHFLCHTFGSHTVEGPVTVFGADGTGLFQGADLDRVSSRNGHMWIDLPLRITTTENMERGVNHD